MKRAANPSARNRSRKKSVAREPASPVASEASAPGAPVEPSDSGTLGSTEVVLSTGVGVLLVIAALFPRSIKQLLMLSIGGGLLYHGMMGIDAAKE